MSNPNVLTRNQHTTTYRILIALVAGLFLGVLLFQITIAWPDTVLAAHVKAVWIDGIFKWGGEVFIRLLKVLVVPLVFFSLICGVCASGSGHHVTRLGLRTLVYYLLTTAIAITIALLLAVCIDPGQGADLGSAQDIFPSNIIQAMAQGSMLQVIVFSILVGLGILHSAGAGQRILAVCEDANTLMLRLVTLVMQIAPYGVFCLVTTVFASKGVEFVVPLFAYVLTVVLALLVHAGLTYGSLLLFLARVNPLRFIQRLFPALIFAFSTASSAATIPITLRLVEKAIGVRNAVAAFTIPLGATLNMDGTAIMQGVATVFIASAAGVDLVFSDYVIIILTATLASVGTAAVPSAGLVTLSIVLLQVGLPAEAIGLILGVDRLLDMLRTALNVLGDATVTAVVARQENLWDQAVFDGPTPKSEA
ncbi:MAG: dicarboxylate/amino acid:cation symporter [Gammaproteobacteria bacterium]